ncbi:hypothetical protein PP175_18055 [Aneurinibacillus sp. Ricciae_BoGa-3]|nr:hypothetical protein [Aneurinibacillus sp. Ricciae_BoGa-3]WCK53288.1 hypothetical protein PP175_18055 [Aneurinibacillus sp. Ricciae_BoGa-3]
MNKKQILILVLTTLLEEVARSVLQHFGFPPYAIASLTFLARLLIS